MISSSCARGFCWDLGCVSLSSQWRCFGHPGDVAETTAIARPAAGISATAEIRAGRRPESCLRLIFWSCRVVLLISRLGNVHEMSVLESG